MTEPLDIRRVLAQFDRRWYEWVGDRWRGIEDPGLLPEALAVLEQVLELLIRYPQDPADFLQALPKDDRDEIWALIVRTVDQEPQPADWSPLYLSAVLRGLQVQEPRLRNIDEDALARRLLRLTLNGMVSVVVTGLNQFLYRDFHGQRLTDPGLIEPMARALRRTSALGPGDHQAIDGLPGICTDVLPREIVVPILHELLRDPHSTARLKTRVLEDLMRYELPLPAL